MPWAIWEVPHGWAVLQAGLVAVGAITVGPSLFVFARPAGSKQMLKLGRPKKVWPVIEDMDHLPAPSTRRIAIYTSRPDSPLAANQLAAIQRYACAMGWVTVAIVESDEQRLLDLAATHALDLVLCWRTSDLRRAESLVQRLSVHSIELLAVAQSCTALME